MELILLILVALVIVALNKSSKALREIEQLRERLRKLSLHYSSLKDNELKEISGSSKKTDISPPDLPPELPSSLEYISTIWTDSKKYETNCPLLVNFCITTKGDEIIPDEIKKARVTLVRERESDANSDDRQIITSKLLDFDQDQIRSTTFYPDKEGIYRVIVNYGELGKEALESEEFEVLKQAALETTDSSEHKEEIEATAKLKASTKAARTTTEPLVESDESLEIKLGTYWFVRIGVLLLLTGLASLAWFKKDFFLDLSAGTKVTLFYILSFGMGGLGLWLNRRKKELQNFGQVLIAGSFAGTYFTTYAAHIFEPVKIIQNSSLALILLFVLGSLMIGVAEKLKSQTIALFAIGSSYYATYVPLIHQGTISPWIILASNLILAIASVVFMVRNQWFRIPELSMIASYLGFFVWRFLEKSPDFLIVTLFLSSLWLVYTVAIFICKHKEFTDNQRATFLTLNNASVFGFMTWEMIKSSTTHFWILGLTVGLILLACAFIASKLLSRYTLTKNAYLIQGLSLATLGLMTTKQSESIKGPILAAETLVLLFSSTRLKNILVRYAAVAASIISLIYGFISINNNSADYLMSSLTIAVFLLAGGILSAKKIENDNSATLRNFTTYFIGTAILMLISALLYQYNHLYNHLENAWIKDPFYNLLFFAAAPIIGCISHYFLRIRELTFLSQIPFIFVAVYSLDFIHAQGSIFHNITILALTLCFIHWWKMQGHIILSPDTKKIDKSIPSLIEICYSVAFITQVFAWTISSTLEKTVNNENWLWLGPLLAISITIYSFITKLKYLGALSQLFLGFACLIQINLCLDGQNDSPILALIPIATLFATLFVLAGANIIASPENYKTIIVSIVKKLYAILLSILTLLWVYNYTPQEYRSLVSIAIAIASCFVSTKTFIVDKKLIQLLSLSYLITGFIYLAGELDNNEASILSLIGILGLMAFQQVSKLSKNSLNISAKIHNALILSASIAIFLWCTVKVSNTTAGLRTITWAGLAVINFLVGISLKERWYRLIGLSILGISLLSLIPIIWNMPTELKITSLFVLGAVFVGLGYIYTRYKDHIKKLL